MKLADLDLMLAQRRDRMLRFLIFDGKMAGVIVDAEMLIQAGIVFVFAADAVEEMDDLAAALQQAKRFGFQAQVQCSTGLRAHSGNVFYAMPNIVPNLGELG